eukprot:CAMPEP_0204846992 /NCGR_PEP_ID=MMETSP1347-20130617/2412_1 /ASSEMBLY_ACC=CAM_ASM_000690 /TAXON_ID=215587 /ORGANISM="Aplanochytrium stocchinoi, Strain GSBS06" /LENGTH=547 /DNA_ID=CAMNT_0051987787 /DNA_START=280 /DNA_END=1924 /DNA_ORIENTATION=-
MGATKESRGAADSLAELVTAGGSQAMHKALKQTYALTKMNKTNHETGIVNVSSNDLRTLFYNYDDEVWYRTLLTLFMNSEPPIVTEACFQGLAEESDKIVVANQSKGKKPDERLLESVQNYLHRLTWLSFIALGEVCAMIRDTAVDFNAVTAALGPALLLGNTGYKGSASPKDILGFLCSNCEYYFGIGKLKEDSLGMRDMFVKIEDEKDPFAPQKNSLRNFYKRVNPAHARIVDELFELYDFSTLGKALFDEYDALPEGWKSLLADDPKTRTWYDNTIPDINSLSYTEIPDVHINKSFKASRNRDTILCIVDEIVDSEFAFHNIMHTFNEKYVKAVTREALRLQGSEKGSKASLGLSEQEVDRIFGKRLSDVIALVENMIIELEVLRLVRDPIDRPGGRPGVLAEIFLRNQSKFQSIYGPYNAEMKSTTAVVKRAIEETPASKNFSKNATVLTGMTFDEMWDIVSDREDVLKSKTIDSILIQPVKRFPNYIMLFKRLQGKVLKASDPSDPVHEKLKRVVELCQKITGKIDQIIQSEGKVRNLLGID